MKEFLRCLLLPIRHTILLVPYSAVAEIVKIDVKAMGDPKPGHLLWRGTEVPLMDLGSEESLEQTTRRHVNIAILNRLSDPSPVDFVGLVLHGLPTMHRYKRSDIEWIAKATERYGLMEVEVRAQKVLIPNLHITGGLGCGGLRFGG